MQLTKSQYLLLPALLHPTCAHLFTHHHHHHPSRRRNSHQPKRPRCDLISASCHARYTVGTGRLPSEAYRRVPGCPALTFKLQAHALHKTGNIPSSPTQRLRSRNPAFQSWAERLTEPCQGFNLYSLPPFFFTTITRPLDTSTRTRTRPTSLPAAHVMLPVSLLVIHNS